jgi:hypothetical protein
MVARRRTGAWLAYHHAAPHGDGCSGRQYFLVYHDRLCQAHPGGPALGDVSRPPAPACPQVVLPQSRLSPPHLHRTAAHRRRPLGAAHPAARSAPCRPRHRPRGDGWGAPRPRVGPGRESQHPAAGAAPAACPVVSHPHGPRGGRFRPAETPYIWHHPGGFCRKFSFKAICGMVSPSNPCCQGGARRWRSASKGLISHQTLF